MSLDADELRRLREELHAEEPERRESAVRRLVAMVEANAPVMLTEALTSDSDHVREQAVLLLDRMADSGDPALEDIVSAVRGLGPGA